MAQDTTDSNVDFTEKLCGLWDVFRNEKMPYKDQKRYAEFFEELKRYMVNIVRSKQSSDKIYTADMAEEMVDKFLIEEVLGGNTSRPEHIASVGVLVQEFKKFGAREGNRYGYEVNGDLRAALLDLERKEKIVRVGTPQSARIRGTTGFMIPGCEAVQEVQNSTLAEIEKKVSRYGEGKRDDSTEHKHFLKMGEAAAMIMEILGKLPRGEYVTLDDFQRIAIKHIRNFPSFALISVEEMSLMNLDGGEAQNGEGGEALGQEMQALQAQVDSSSEQGANSSQTPSAGADGDHEKEETPPETEPADEYGTYYRDMVLRMSKETTKRIWSSVEKLSCEKLFCLYSLPNLDRELSVSGSNHVQAEFGDPKRISEKNEQLRKIYEDNVRGLVLGVNSNDDEFILDWQLTCLRIIEDSLIGKCTEKGFDPSL